MMLKMLYRLPRHPIDTFYDLKYKKDKKWWLPAIVALFGFLLVSIIEFQYTDFVFNSNRVDRLNIGILLFRTIILFILWVISNWSFCTLFDGEGTLLQIFCLSALSLIPYEVSVIIKTLLSQLLIGEEEIFLEWIVLIGIAFSVYLMVTGLYIVHGYTIKRTIFSILLTVLGILIVLFILTLLFSLVQQFFAFVMTIFTELSLMIGG